MRSVLQRMVRAAYEAGADILEVPRAELPRVEDFAIRARDGHAMPARLYAPSLDAGLPVLLYVHGGGFTIGSIATHDVLCRELARRAGCMVVSLDYRLAPEHKFPTACHDAWDALAWLAAHADTLGGDRARLAVGGDSAGGTLSAVNAILARDAGLPLALQLLFYPGCAAHQDTPSHATYARGLVLEEPAITWFFGNYVTTRAQREDWRFAPLHADDVEGVARPGRVRPAGGRGRGLRRQAACSRRAGGSGDLPRRHARIHQDGPRYSRGAAGPCRRGRRAAPGLWNGVNAMQRRDFRCFHRLRVRWAEVDMQKIVFNAHYLMYVDTAMMDYWRALALPYEESMVALGGDMYVKKASLEYHASAHLDDRVDVGMRCERVGNSSVLFHAGLFRGEKLLVSAELAYVFAAPATQPSKPVPPTLRALLTGFEAGEAMAAVHVGSWDALGPDAARLRQAVFVEELGLPAELEADAHDAGATHAVLRNHLGMPVATGRLLQEAPGVGRIGRLAVDGKLRGAGWGCMVLDALLNAARARGDQRVVLDAEASAQGFYQRMGFVVCGEPFVEAGIHHVSMECVL